MDHSHQNTQQNETEGPNCTDPTLANPMSEGSLGDVPSASSTDPKEYDTSPPNTRYTTPDSRDSRKERPAGEKIPINYTRSARTHSTYDAINGLNDARKFSTIERPTSASDQGKFHTSHSSRELRNTDSSAASSFVSSSTAQKLNLSCKQNQNDKGCGPDTDTTGSILNTDERFHDTISSLSLSEIMQQVITEPVDDKELETGTQRYERDGNLHDRNKRGSVSSNKLENHNNLQESHQERDDPMRNMRGEETRTETTAGLPGRTKVPPRLDDGEKKELGSLSLSQTCKF